MNTLHDVIDSGYVLAKGYILRQDYIFAALTKSNIYDAIVIRNPIHCECWSPRMYGFPSHSLEEHIAFINQNKLEKAIIIAEDISFITRCPTLKYLRIILADSAPSKFDYSPLYDMPEIKQLTCTTAYGGSHEPYSTTVDYARVSGLSDLGVSGKGHLNYNLVDTLEALNVSGNKIHRDLENISNSKNLKKLWLLQCSLQTLEGIKRFQNLQNFSISYMRSLQDISQLSSVANSLRALSIENCPKITDFSCLYDLVNLEHLCLHGKNDLPSLQFLERMDKLQTFTFSMNVVDCDLTPCLQIPYASSFKNKKQYNLKDKDLPKQLPTKAFELM